MLGSKYQFNPETLSYTRVSLSIRERLLKLSVIVFSAAALIALISFTVFSLFIDSADYRHMQREKKQLIQQYDVLNQRVEKLSSVLTNLQDNDDNIYRVIYNLNPISKSVREAGFGGTDRYKDLKGFDNSSIVVSTTQKIDKLTKQFVVQSNSYDEIVKIANQRKDRLASIPAISPVSKKRARLASFFGYRIHPILRTKRMHEGVDFSAPRGTKVYATADGVVRNTKYSGGYGRQILIDHGHGYKTRYAHLNKSLVRRGQKVKRGDLIGHVGSTGLSTSPHLHYEVLKNGSPVNPINYYFNDITPEEYNQLIARTGN